MNTADLSGIRAARYLLCAQLLIRKYSATISSQHVFATKGRREFIFFVSTTSLESENNYLLKVDQVVDLIEWPTNSVPSSATRVWTLVLLPDSEQINNQRPVFLFYTHAQIAEQRDITIEFRDGKYHLNAIQQLPSDWAMLEKL